MLQDALTTEYLPGIGTAVIARQAVAAPTLIHLTGLASDAMGPTYNKLPERLYDQGWTVLSIDLPAHGDDRAVEESLDGLFAWRQRVLAGRNIVSEFAIRLARLVDVLATDPAVNANAILLSGISRGGYMAISGLSLVGSIRAGIAFMPVTDLGCLTEFGGVSVVTLDTFKLSWYPGPSALAARPLWVSMGLNDTRVSTAAAVAWANHVYARNAATNTTNTLEFTLEPSDDHLIALGAEDRAAAWAQEHA